MRASLANPGAVRSGLREGLGQAVQAERTAGAVALRWTVLECFINRRLNCCPRFYFSGIRDVSKWSERTRKPLETLYGYDYFAKTCEKWVDGIKQFKLLPDGRLHELSLGSLAD